MRGLFAEYDWNRHVLRLDLMQRWSGYYAWDNALCMAVAWVLHGLAPAPIALALDGIMLFNAMFLGLCGNLMVRSLLRRPPA